LLNKYWPLILLLCYSVHQISSQNSSSKAKADYVVVHKEHPIFRGGGSDAVWHFHSKQKKFDRGRGGSKNLVFGVTWFINDPLLLHTKNKEHIRNNIDLPNKQKRFPFPFVWLIYIGLWCMKLNKQEQSFSNWEEKKNGKRKNCNFSEWNFLNCCKYHVSEIAISTLYSGYPTNLIQFTIFFVERRMKICRINFSFQIAQFDFVNVCVCLNEGI